MKDFIKRTRLFLPLIVLPLLLSNCLKNSGPDFQSLIRVNYNLTGLDTEISDQQDTLRVLNTRLTFGNMNLVKTNDQTESLSSSKIVTNYSLAANGQDLNLVRNEISEGSYKDMTFRIEQPETGSVEEYVNASVVVSGFYNGELFEFISESTIPKSLTLGDTLTIAEQNSSAYVSLSAEVSKWFTDSSTGEVLNPNASSNRPIIDENIKRSFTAEAASL